MNQLKESILQIFPETMQKWWDKVEGYFRDLQEIRFRVNQPIVLVIKGNEYFLSNVGELITTKKMGRYMDAGQLQMLIEHICNYSIYAYAKEISQGFITVAGGHRIGVAGQVVLDDANRVKAMKYITYINVRISHQMIGVADAVIPMLYQKEQFINTLIISPPGCGKTTLLRDIIRQVSNGNNYGESKTIGVVDERSEIAGSYKGIAQNDIGSKTDIMDRCPKYIGMMMMIRSMSPEIIAIDELGSEKELEALLIVAASGCNILATIHGSGMEDLQQNYYGKKLLEQNLFQCFIVLEKVNGHCTIKKIYK